MPGSPIRTPWDHSSVDSSPRPIAASHVLHRLLVPRHPPYALKNLTTKSFKDARIHCAILNQHQTRHSLSASSCDQPATVMKQHRISTEPTAHDHSWLIVSGPNRVPVRTANRISDSSTPLTWLY